MGPRDLAAASSPHSASGLPAQVSREGALGRSIFFIGTGSLGGGQERGGGETCHLTGFLGALGLGGWNEPQCHVPAPPRACLRLVLPPEQLVSPRSLEEMEGQSWWSEHPVRGRIQAPRGASASVAL